MTLLDDGESFAVETRRDGEYRLKLVGAILVLGWLLDDWGREQRQGDMLPVLLAIIAGLRTRQLKRDALAHLQAVADDRWPDDPHIRLVFLVLCIRWLESQNEQVA